MLDIYKHLPIAQANGFFLVYIHPDRKSTGPVYAGQQLPNIQHAWCSSIQELASHQLQADISFGNTQLGHGVYFSTGSFAEGSRRTKEFCTRQHSVFLDIDIDPNNPAKHASVEEVLQLLVGWVEAKQLPEFSTVVHSGGGLHVYWNYHDPEQDTVKHFERWQLLSDYMKAGALTSGIKIDRAVTGDSARVLRLPNTVNTKAGRGLCELVYPAPTDNPIVYDHDTLYASLYQFQGAIANSLKNIAGNKAPAPQFNFLQGMQYEGLQSSLSEQVDSMYKPASWQQIEVRSKTNRGCGILKAVMEDNNVEYDMWCGVTSIAVLTDDPQRAIDQTCGKYQGYNYAESYNKGVSFNGPRTCDALSEAWGDPSTSPCNTCLLKGRITSPITIGQEGFLVSGDTESLSRTITDHSKGSIKVALIDTLPVLPFPYKAMPDQPGIFIQTKDEDGTVQLEKLMDEDIRLHKVAYERLKTGKQVARLWFRYMHPMQGEQLIPLYAHELTENNGSAAINTLASHWCNMTDSGNKNWRHNVSRFLNALVREYAVVRAAEQTVTQFGPLGDNSDTFVLGEWAYKTNGQVEPVLLAEGQVRRYGAQMAQPPRTEAQIANVAFVKEAWNVGLAETIGSVPGKVSTFLPDQFILMTGFGVSLAPFIVPSRQRGGLIVPNCDTSGAGKSSMVARAVQMYMGGDDTLLVPNTTQMAFLERNVAVAGALPVCWDEMMKTRSDQANQQVYELALNSTDRKPRQRLTGDGNTPTWQSWIYATMNPDPHEAIGAVSSAGNGAIARVLNVKIPPNRFGSGAELLQRQQTENEFNNWCKDNANIIGREWVAHFITRIDHLKTRYKFWVSEIEKNCPEVFADMTARISIATVAASMTAAEEASKAGLHPFDITEVFAYSCELLEMTIKRFEDTVVPDESLLSMLLNASPEALLVRHTAGPSINDRLPNRTIGVRVEVHPNGEQALFISVTHAKSFCKLQGIDFNRLKNYIINSGGTLKRKRMAAGTPLDGANTNAFHLRRIPTESGELVFAPYVETAEG